MSSIKVVVRQLELVRTRSSVPVQRPRPVAETPARDQREPTLAERVFQFLDQRSA